jgi:hypothetical protein
MRNGSIMAKQGGSRGRGRRLRHEVPEPPARDGLSQAEGVAQEALRRLVDASGGRFDGPHATPISIGSVEVLADLLDEWGRRHAVTSPVGHYFPGRPGFWHAFDRLCPLQDPNRWDRLREATIAELELRGWRRRTPPRGSAFDLPE